MKLLIDIILLAIIALCTWGGYKRGLIGSVAAILAIVIAMFGGSLIASAYSGEVVPAMRPFVDGYIDSQNTRKVILEDLVGGATDRSVEDVLGDDPTLRRDYAYDCMVIVGIRPEAAEGLALKAVELAGKDGDMKDAVVRVICETACYVGCLIVCFLLILILLVSVGSVLNLSLRLPNMENVDEIGGAALGFVKGFLYCVLLSWALGFFGMVIGRGTLSGTVLARFFLAFRFVTAGLL